MVLISKTMSRIPIYVSSYIIQISTAILSPTKQNDWWQARETWYWARRTQRRSSTLPPWLCLGRSNGCACVRWSPSPSDVSIVLSILSVSCSTECVQVAQHLFNTQRILIRRGARSPNREMIYSLLDSGHKPYACTWNDLPEGCLEVMDSTKDSQVECPASSHRVWDRVL